MPLPLIVLAGPTAVGKTSLSIRLAEELGGEIISADSMQVYRHMDIGSAKAAQKEREKVRHHLIDVLEPTKGFHVALFQKLAKQALCGIYARGKVPIVTGGTGFYIQALVFDIDFTENDSDQSLRIRLEQTASQKGAACLHEMLRRIDPAAAAQIHENNVKRVIRAIEFYQKTGTRISDHNEAERKKKSPYHLFYYVLTTDREVLYDRINQRVDKMMEQGLVEEVKQLVQMGCTRDMVSMQGLGYKEILDYLEGNRSLEEAVCILKRDTRHFAKRQLTWFKREKEARWLNLPDFQYDMEKVLEHILEEFYRERRSQEHDG